MTGMPHVSHLHPNTATPFLRQHINTESRMSACKMFSAIGASVVAAYACNALVLKDLEMAGG